MNKFSFGGIWVWLAGERAEYVALRLSDPAWERLRLRPHDQNVLGGLLTPGENVAGVPAAQELYRSSSDADVERYCMALPRVEQERIYIRPVSAGRRYWDQSNPG